MRAAILMGAIYLGDQIGGNLSITKELGYFVAVVWLLFLIMDIFDLTTRMKITVRCCDESKDI